MHYLTRCTGAPSTATQKRRWTFVKEPRSRRTNAQEYLCPRGGGMREVLISLLLLRMIIWALSRPAPPRFAVALQVALLKS